MINERYGIIDLIAVITQDFDRANDFAEWAWGKDWRLITVEESLGRWNEKNDDLPQRLDGFPSLEIGKMVRKWEYEMKERG